MRLVYDAVLWWWYRVERITWLCVRKRARVRWRNVVVGGRWCVEIRSVCIRMGFLGFRRFVKSLVSWGVIQIFDNLDQSVGLLRLQFNVFFGRFVDHNNVRKGDVHLLAIWP